jgi:class 3 adenylate cyclase
MSSSSSSSSPTVQNCSLLKEDPLFGAKNESRAEFGLERVLVIVGLLSVFVVVLGLPLGVWFVRREKIKKKRGRKQDDWRKQLERSLEHIFRLWAKNNKIEKKKHFLNKSSWLLCGSGRGGDDDGIGIDGSASSTNFLRNSIFGSFSMRRSGGSAATSFSSQCITEGTEIDQVPLVFVFTDIENSTLLSDTNPTVYREVQEAHDLVMRDNLDEFCGYEINTEGDSFQCCFEKCSHAVLFCEKVQEDLLSYEWSKKVCNLPGLGEMTSYVQKHQMASERVETVWKGPRVRMGIHASSTKNNCYRMEKKATGSLEFSGPAFEVTHEVESAASGGQILLTQHALDLGRQEEEIFHVSTFHLGTFVLRCGFEVNLYQARPSRGALSNRSFPLLRIEQSAPGRGLNTLKAPEGSICFVCLRLDQQGKKQKEDEDDGARSSTLRRRFTVTKKNSRNNNNKKNSFWSTLSSSLRYQLESSLRMWMQQFGGYEVCLPDSDVLLVTFSNKETAIRFCMATQIALLLESWSKDITSQPHMKDVYTDNKVRDKYIYRGPRLAIALLSCNGDEYSSSRPPSLRYQPSKACSKVQQQPPLPPLGGEEGEERSVKRVQNSVLLMRMAAPLFMSGEKTKIGQCMANSKAWYDHYPATACSRYCGTDISPSSYLGKKHLVFFFYFTNKTLGCAFEAKYFRDFHHLFASAGAEVIGVSLDSTESQAAFSSGLRLPYPLICDTPGGLHALFGSFDISMLMRRT